MMIKKIHRGRGRPRKNPLPDQPLPDPLTATATNFIISKQPRSSSKAVKIENPPRTATTMQPPPPMQWHGKRSRSVAAFDGRTTAATSSSSGLVGQKDDDDLGYQCLADFEIPGPIPDLGELMSDMRIFHDFFKDLDFG